MAKQPFEICGKWNGNCMTPCSFTTQIKLCRMLKSIEKFRTTHHCQIMARLAIIESFCPYSCKETGAPSRWHSWAWSNTVAVNFFTSQNFMLWTRLYFDYILHVQSSQQALFQSWLRRIASSLSIGSDTPSSVKGVCPARILSGCDAPNCTSNRQKTEKVQMWLEILSGRLL